MLEELAATRTARGLRRWGLHHSWRGNRDRSRSARLSDRGRGPGLQERRCDDQEPPVRPCAWAPRSGLVGCGSSEGRSLGPISACTPSCGPHLVPLDQPSKNLLGEVAVDGERMVVDQGRQRPSGKSPESRRVGRHPLSGRSFPECHPHCRDAGNANCRIDDNSRLLYPSAFME